MTTTLERPAESAGELYVPTGIAPEDAFQAIGCLRQEARDEIERLLSFVDAGVAPMPTQPAEGVTHAR